MEEHDARASGSGDGTFLNELKAPGFQLPDGPVDILDLEAEMVDPLPPGLQETAQGRIPSQRGDELDGRPARRFEARRPHPAFGQLFDRRGLHPHKDFPDSQAVLKAPDRYGDVVRTAYLHLNLLRMSSASV